MTVKVMTVIIDASIIDDFRFIVLFFWEFGFSLKSLKVLFNLSPLEGGV